MIFPLFAALSMSCAIAFPSFPAAPNNDAIGDVLPAGPGPCNMDLLPWEIKRWKNWVRGQIGLSGGKSFRNLTFPLASSFSIVQTCYLFLQKQLKDFQGSNVRAVPFQVSQFFLLKKRQKNPKNPHCGQHHKPDYSETSAAPLTTIKGFFKDTVNVH